MSQLIGTVGALLIFGAIIAIHEFGHFIAAKWSGMGVFEFSLGFGPAIFKKEYRGTLYALRIIPLGGYVRIAGMELGEEDAPNGYDKKSFFAKFATLTAGVVMNFVLALLVFIIIGLAIGYYRPNPEPVVGKIVPDFPAAQSGVKIGDRIVAVDGTPVSTWEETVKAIRTGTEKTVSLEVVRQGVVDPLKIVVTPRLERDAERVGLRLHLTTARVLGIQNTSGTYVKENPIASIKDGFLMVTDRTLLVVASLVSMIVGDISFKDIGGPLQVMRISYDVSQGALKDTSGIASFLSLLAFLSVNIGFMNILPLPALDGGRLLFLIIEGIRRKPMDKEKEALIHTVGLLVLLGLIVLITFKDAWQWIGDAVKK